MEKVCDNDVIATPYYSTTLKQRIKQWNGNETNIKTFTKQLLTGVAHLHSQGIKIAHRDIKADNILVSDEGKPIIIDFGMANCKNLAAGTPGLLAPEQEGMQEGPFGAHHRVWWYLNGWDQRLVDSWNIGLLIKRCFRGYEIPTAA